MGKFFRGIVKTYRIFILLLFVAGMALACFILWHFYNFIQPVEYETRTVREITEPGELTVIIKSSGKIAAGAILVSPKGREYTQSSRDIENIIEKNQRTLKIKTAEKGNWQIKYRKVPGVKLSISANFNKSNAAMLISTKAVKDETNGKITLSVEMSGRNYTYTMKAVRRKDGFSLTSSGNGGQTIELQPYAYEGVWDFYLNTTTGEEVYSTMFSYTF